jgi:hypothetical protein
LRSACSCACWLTLFWCLTNAFSDRRWSCLWWIPECMFDVQLHSNFIDPSRNFIMFCKNFCETSHIYLPSAAFPTQVWLPITLDLQLSYRKCNFFLCQCMISFFNHSSFIYFFLHFFDCRPWYMLFWHLSEAGLSDKTACTMQTCRWWILPQAMNMRRLHVGAFIPFWIFSPKHPYLLFLNLMLV